MVFNPKNNEYHLKPNLLITDEHLKIYGSSQYLNSLDWELIFSYTRHMQGQGVFDPNFYIEFRPFYPASTFAGLQDRLTQAGFSTPFQIADIGCGTAHSILSLLNSRIPANITGIDPDPSMLLTAEKLIQDSSHKNNIQLQVGSAESLNMIDACMDAVLIGSAFHWMNAQSSALEFYRVLKPRGLLRVFEYQFPKSISHPALNNWIKQQFNEKWKAPGQTPRGTFKQVTQVFRNNPHWKLTEENQPQMILALTPDQLTGLILSQSRVYHYESQLEDHEKLEFRSQLRLTISQIMKDFLQLEFDFKLTWVEFQKVSARASSADSTSNSILRSYSIE
jgi:ubiquinone/menaquinone biosynthesis C-methylase UbiE